MELLQLEATLFRSALEQADFTGDGNLRGFPDRCCHHACILFGIYLLENGFGPSTKVVARRQGTPESQHVWLVHQGLIVDLTADQFVGEGQPRVLVSSDSSWHAGWTRVPAEDQVIDSDYCQWKRQEWYEGPYRKVCVALAGLKK